MNLSILFNPFQKVIFLCEGRALEVAQAVLPSHSPPGYAKGCFADAKSARTRTKQISLEKQTSQLYKCHTL